MSATKKARSKDQPAGSAVEKPDYGEKDQPKPIGVNRTDAEGIDSSTQPGAREGISAEDATPHTTPEVTDPTYHTRRAMEARLHGEEDDESERLPHVLISDYDVRRGDQVYRIPHGSVVTETELTDEEFDHALAQGIVREATVAEVRQQEARDARREEEERQAKLRRESVGVKPKKGSEDKPPKGATMVADLQQDAEETQRSVAARRVLATRGKAS